jgi:hypothetical protein
MMGVEDSSAVSHMLTVLAVIGTPVGPVEAGPTSQSHSPTILLFARRAAGADKATEAELGQQAHMHPGCTAAAGGAVVKASQLAE